MMRRVQAPLLFLFGFLLVAAPAIGQQPTSADYLAARDRASAALVEKFGPCSKPKPGLSEDALDAEATRLSKELEPAMQRAIGHVDLPHEFSILHFQASGLGCGVGVDALDGLRFTNGPVSSDSSTMLVTTGDILRGWLKRNEPDHPEWQADPDTAFRSRAGPDLMYRDGWWASFAAMPIDKPVGVDAVVVLLGEGGNGDLIWPPTGLSVYLRMRDRIVLADVALATPFVAIAACSNAERGTIRPPDASPDALGRSNKCWEQRGRQEPAFTAAIRQAQDFVNQLAKM